MSIKQGDKAPDFAIQGIDENGEEKEFKLSELLKSNENIILYFYPKDNTPGCTQEACDFRDNFNRLTNKALVLGVSPDSIASHKKFKDKKELNFPLLSDTDYEVLKAYGAWGEKKMYGKTFLGVIRSTFIINKEGIIQKAWHKVKVKGHVDEVIQSL